MEPGFLIRDPHILAGYSRDQASFGWSEQPLALARPNCVEDVVTLVQYCEANDLSIVPRGAGTGLSGGANALNNSVIVSFEQMNSILSIDKAERFAVVQPGVVNQDLRQACLEHDLWYPPDPASAHWSTIGGNVSTNAGGLSCVKYGVTRDYVAALQVICSGGRIIRLGGRTVKRAAGYDLKNLFVGSGGTLGIITEITVRLRSIHDTAQTVVGYFDTLQAAGNAADRLAAAGVVPSCFELVDRTCLNAVASWKNLDFPHDCAVLLLAQTDTPGDAGEAEVDGILASFDGAGATWSARSTNASEAEAFIELRRLIYPALERSGEVLTEDICVPRTRVSVMLEKIQEIAGNYNLSIANIAHIGDGNIHPMIIVARGDEELRVRGERAFADIVSSAINLGGTSSGEHGIGLLKKTSFAKEVGSDVLDIHRGIKRALDPNNVFNPMKIFDL